MGASERNLPKTAMPVRNPDLPSLFQSPEAAGDTGGSGAALKAFAVLEAAAYMRRDLSVSELSALADIPKPTMHRLVRQLESDGLLQRGLHGRLRGPGPRLVSFALNVLRYWAEAAPRQALLQTLSNKIGETCNLGVMEGNAVVYIDRVESKWPFGLKFEPGSKVPLHCTSMGKLFLSEVATAKRRDLLQVSSLHRYTENTICDADALDREVQEIKKRGYSIDDQEFLAGVVCLAVPVRTADGTLCAALAISAPAARLSIGKALQQLPIMMSTAENLGAQLQRQSSADRDGLSDGHDSDSIEGLKHRSNRTPRKDGVTHNGEEQK
jgi:DNA-binding IclR family transcriptional regulator